MRRIAFINEKGGTCKTTLAVNLGAWLAREKGKKVLLVDLDTQGHCGKSLGVDVRQARRTVFDLLLSPEVEASEVALPTAIPNLSLIPSNKQLAEFPVAAAAFPDRELRLAQKLDALEGFDFVVLDSPPSTGLVTTNIFMAAREIVIPVSLSYLALDGCAEIMTTVRNLEEQRGKRDLKVTMVVPTLYRRTALADAILGKLRDYFPNELCKTALGMSVKIDEAQSHGRTIWEYAPKSKGAEMLAAIARELVARGNESSSKAA